MRRASLAKSVKCHALLPSQARTPSWRDPTCSGTAITINASKVDLSLGGHTLTGDGTGSGIYVLRQANVRIHQGTVQNFETGVLMEGTTDCTLDRLNALHNSSVGLAGRAGTSGLTVTANTANDNGTFGILIDSYSGENTITHNTANENHQQSGIAVWNGFSNSITRNTAKGNSFSGIDVSFGAFNNTVMDNTVTYNGSGLAANGGWDNVLARNVSDRNGSGIELHDSLRIVIQHNSMTGNQNIGIQLMAGSNENTVKDNEIIASPTGIWLGLVPPGVSFNTVTGNSITLSVRGIG